VLELVATRGEDGVIGLDISDDPIQQAYNVVVGITGQAERDGQFMLGDVMITCDGVSLFPEGGAAMEARAAMEAGKACYTFQVLRAAAVAPLPPGTPSTELFRAAAKLREKHMKLARASGGDQAMLSVTDKEANLNAELRASAMDTPRRAGREESEKGLAM